MMSSASGGRDAGVDHMRRAKRVARRVGKIIEFRAKRLVFPTEKTVERSASGVSMLEANWRIRVKNGRLAEHMNGISLHLSFAVWVEAAGNSCLKAVYQALRMA